MKFMRGSAAVTLEVGHSLVELSAKGTGGHTCRMTPNSTPEDVKMPEVLTLPPSASTGPEPALRSVALRSVGLGHRRTAPLNFKE